MDLDVAGIKNAAAVKELASRAKKPESDAAQQTRKKAKIAAERRRFELNAEQYLKEILNYTEFFNKRLRFSVNRELNQVVVKVIDSQTDKVIKEIPPEVLQRLHVRIREAIGLLIDEVI